MAEGIEQAAGVCGCSGGGTCNVTVNVKGCNSLNLPGATVTYWTDATKAVLLDTQTTDASGNATLNVGSAGSYYRETSYSPRFSTLGTSGAVACSTTYNDVLTPAIGYQCLAGCVIPVKTTLTFTHSLFGVSNGVWSYAYPFCVAVPCLGQTITVNATFDAAIGLLSTLHWLFDSSAGECPSDLGGGGTADEASSLNATSSYTCPPAFSWSGHYTVNGASSAAIKAMYCYTGTPITVTLTITE